MNVFLNLSPVEKGQLEEAPLLVTLLVGAADGKFDREEKTWSAKLVNTKTYSNPKSLNDFWDEVSRDFLQKIEALADSLPADAAARNEQIAEKLAALNPILAKLDKHTAWYLFKSLRQLAEETAAASGGFLRIGAVSAAEHRWVKLPMIREIARPTDLPVVSDEGESD